MVGALSSSLRCLWREHCIVIQGSQVGSYRTHSAGQNPVVRKDPQGLKTMYLTLYVFLKSIASYLKLCTIPAYDFL